MGKDMNKATQRDLLSTFLARETPMKVEPYAYKEHFVNFDVEWPTNGDDPGRCAVPALFSCSSRAGLSPLLAAASRAAAAD